VYALKLLSFHKCNLSTRFKKTLFYFSKSRIYIREILNRKKSSGNKEISKQIFISLITFQQNILKKRQMELMYFSIFHQFNFVSLHDDKTNLF